MKPKSFRVENFKCIEDSGWVELEDLTCLIGKNQSGKTAFLNAIEKLNSEHNNSNYEYFKEYPRERYSEYELRHEDDPDRVVSAKFYISDEELQEIETEYGEQILEDREVKVSKDYKNRLHWDLNINEKRYIEDFLSMFDLPARTKQMLEDCTTISELDSKIEESDSEDPELERLKDEINPDNFSHSQNIGSSILEDKIPRFLYLGEYHFLSDEISMTKLQNRMQNNNLNEGDKIFLSLLSLGPCLDA